jgi:hypothetical protein
MTNDELRMGESGEKGKGMKIKMKIKIKKW